jgi:serine/threonine protein kinase
MCKADGLSTLTYMAPEVIGHRQLSPASDVYSLGVLLWQMLTSQQPWQGFSEYKILSAVVTGEHQLVWPDACSAPAGVFRAAWYSIVALGQACIDPKACRRPSMSVVVEQINMLAVVD